MSTRRHVNNWAKTIWCDCWPIVRLSPDAIVRWDYRPNSIKTYVFVRRRCDVSAILAPRYKYQDLLTEKVFNIEYLLQYVFIISSDIAILLGCVLELSLLFLIQRYTDTAVWQTL